MLFHCSAQEGELKAILVGQFFGKERMEMRFQSALVQVEHDGVFLPRLHRKQKPVVDTAVDVPSKEGKSFGRFEGPFLPTGVTINTYFHFTIESGFLNA